jgi:hypothetical protein
VILCVTRVTRLTCVSALTHQRGDGADKRTESRREPGVERDRAVVDAEGSVQPLTVDLGGDVAAAANRSLVKSIHHSRALLKRWPRLVRHLARWSELPPLSAHRVQLKVAAAGIEKAENRPR